MDGVKKGDVKIEMSNLADGKPEAEISRLSFDITRHTEDSPGEFRYELFGLKGDCLCLPEKGFLERAICFRPRPSEYNRMNGLVAVLATTGLLAVASYTIYKQNPTGPSGTGWNVTNTNGSSQTLLYAGPTNQDSVNLFIIIVTFIGAAWGLYKGVAAAFCKPAKDRDELAKKSPV